MLRSSLIRQGPTRGLVLPVQIPSLITLPLNLSNETGFSRWNYGTRSETAHLTSSLSPTWQLDMSASAKRSHFDEVGLQNVYQIVDNSGAASASQFTAQGLGFTQNPQSTTTVSVSIRKRLSISMASIRFR